MRTDGTCNSLAATGGFVHQDSVTPKLFQATGLTNAPFPTTMHQRGSRSTPTCSASG